MKKAFSILLAALCYAGISGAQRLVLYEEFTGQNCGQCAQYNPALQGLLSANGSKIIALQYHTNVPSAGSINLQNPADVAARKAYYAIDSVPTGRIDGTGIGTGTVVPTIPGHVANLTQADINAAYATATPFAITATHTWSADGDSIYATVNVTANTAFAPAGANMRLRVALVEHLQFQQAPGTNGETDFPNVMRKMYPDASGTAAPNSWTASQTATFQIAGPVPSHVNKANEAFIIVWLQNDANKVVAQTAKSVPLTIALDAASLGINLPGKIACGAQNAVVTPSVILKNAGTTTLTSATILFRSDNGALQTLPWTGSLPPTATISVNLPPLSFTSGLHTIYDSAINPNGQVDINYANGAAKTKLYVHDDAPNNLPIATGFENAGGMPNGWLLYDENDNGDNWAVWSGVGNAAHGFTKYALIHRNFYYSLNETNYAILPQAKLDGAGPEALDFWMAYAQYTSENDRLEVVYSTDCGQNWTPLWSGEGAGLATAAPVGNNTEFYPAAGEWRRFSIDLAPVPTTAMIAFRATSQFGNNLFLDDVILRSGVANSVPDLATATDFSVYPNPASTVVNARIFLRESANVSGSLIDLTGRVVRSFEGNYAAGQQEFPIAVDGLAPGMYTLRLDAGSSTFRQKISVTR